ncbi:putative spliceosome associated protein [Danaus plexippus plexippus]|uniref:Spliceosome associated protein n=1 Tax=Danaus plexippus plexippus TaxID=278856 RepID=A0A212EXU4_DANPL|nr:putative spliceosome associated protein [Danaus plexippus plexippus]
MIVTNTFSFKGVWCAFIQIAVVVLINIPTVSFGLAMGWVSLVSGEAPAEEAEASGRGAVIAAVTTFGASMAGVPLSARALLYGRKFALIGTSACFALCWTLKLASLWCGSEWSGVGAALVVVARIAAGLGGASAWALEPLLAREMCSSQYRGAAVSALSLAHNVGVLAMYLAADAAVPHKTVLYCCLSLALVHCVAFTFVPESPSFLAANGKMEEARLSLARLRGVSSDHPELIHAFAALPPTEEVRSPLLLARQMLSDRQRRRAFIIGTITVIGQEVCGVLAILQYAERMFVIARDETRLTDSVPPTTPLKTEIMNDSKYLIWPTTNEVIVKNLTSNSSNISAPALSPTLHDLSAGVVTDELLSPARHAVLLGTVQLLTSALSLYLVERFGRRPLLLWCSVVTGACLVLAALVTGTRVSVGGLVAADVAALAIAGAVAADSAGLQHVPYAILSEMFHYEYRGCAVMLAIAGACAGNALEVLLFPGVVAFGGLMMALTLAAVLTFLYTVFVALAVPETKDRTPEQIYDVICPRHEGTCKTIKKVSDVELRRYLKCDQADIIIASVEMGLLEKLSSWMGGGGKVVTVLVLGLDNSGKSTMLRTLRTEQEGQGQGAGPASSVPTIGQQQENFQSGGVSFRAWDVSGAARLRALWERHYRHSDAVIFVVDSADHLRLVVARSELELMLSHPDMAGRRLPFFTTLGLERITDKPWHVCESSALSGEGLDDGVSWLARQLREKH